MDCEIPCGRFLTRGDNRDDLLAVKFSYLLSYRVCHISFFHLSVRILINSFEISKESSFVKIVKDFFFILFYWTIFIFVFSLIYKRTKRNQEKLFLKTFFNNDN